MIFGILHIFLDLGVKIVFLYVYFMLGNGRAIFVNGHQQKPILVTLACNLRDIMISGVRTVK